MRHCWTHRARDHIHELFIVLFLSLAVCRRSELNFGCVADYFDDDCANDHDDKGNYIQIM